MKVKIKYIETQTFCPNKLGTVQRTINVLLRWTVVKKLKLLMHKLVNKELRS